MRRNGKMGGSDKLNRSGVMVDGGDSQAADFMATAYAGELVFIADASFTVRASALDSVLPPYRPVFADLVHRLTEPGVAHAGRQDRSRDPRRDRE